MRAQRATFSALGLGAAALWVVALCVLALFLLIASRPALADPSQSLAQSAQYVQLHPALTPTVARQPTQSSLSQPTAAASSPAAPPASTTLGSNGLTIAVMLSCVTGILGLVVGSVALIALLRGGYGPFLRTLLPGARRASRRASQSRRLGGDGYDRSPPSRRPASSRRR